MPASASARVPHPWVVAGSLLLGTVVLILLQWPGSGLTGATGLLGTLLFSAALVVFAAAPRASVVAGRPLGTWAICLLAGWCVAADLVFRFVLTEPSAAGLVFGGYIDPAVRLALALIAVTEIARAGVVPGRWRFAPAWCLVGVVALWLVQWALAPVAVSAGSSQAAAAVAALGEVTNVVPPLLLGVAAIVFGDRARSGRPSPAQGKQGEGRAGEQREDADGRDPEHLGPGRGEAGTR